MTDLSVIVINYKTHGLLKQCLRGILQHPSKDLAVEVIVVDNASNDGSVEMVRRSFPQVSVIANAHNRGFASGVNQGLAAATGRVRLILNPDLAVFPGVLEALVTYLDEHPTVGMVAPRLLNPDGSVQYSARKFQTPITPLWSRTPLGRTPLFRRKLRDYLLADWDHASERAVDWVLGAAMAVRASAVDEVGPMDEGFFLYLEDLDWCRRFWENGWSVMYYPSVELVHYHQRLSAARGLFGSLVDPATRIHFKSAVRYFKKHRGKPHPKTHA